MKWYRYYSSKKRLDVSFNHTVITLDLIRVKITWMHFLFFFTAMQDSSEYRFVNDGRRFMVFFFLNKSMESEKKNSCERNHSIFRGCPRERALFESLFTLTFSWLLIVEFWMSIFSCCLFKSSRCAYHRVTLISYFVTGNDDILFQVRPFSK